MTMLAQSSSAEVFYDKIRQELRVTSVHQCDSLKSLGRIIGAVTVAFLEQAPKYGNDNCDDADEVQSSDQASQCLLDRSKVWEGIPASLSLIPMPGSPHPPSPSLHHRPIPLPREHCSTAHGPTKVKSGTDCTDEQSAEKKHKSDVEEILDMSTTERSKSVQFSIQSKKTLRRDFVSSKDQSDKRLQLSDLKSPSSSRPQESKVMGRNSREESWQMQTDVEQDAKLSSPSVTNSADAFWRFDPRHDRHSLSPEPSSTNRRDKSSTVTLEHVEKNKERIKFQRAFRKPCDKDESLDYSSRKKEIENVVVKKEVFHDLCHSNAEEEDISRSSEARFDEEEDVGNVTADLVDDEYIDEEDNDAYTKSAELGLFSRQLAIGEPRSPYCSLYSGIGETAFPGVSSLDVYPMLQDSSRSAPGFPFTLPHSSYVSQVSASGSSSLPRPSTSLLPYYPSSSSVLGLNPQGKKGRQRVPTCAVCHAEIKDKNDFATHVSLHSLDDQHNCPVCLKIFSNRANLLRHSALHVLGVLYQCPICCKMIKRGDNFQVHMRKQHPGQSVKMARIVPDFSPDSQHKTLFASTKSAMSDERYQWFGKSTSQIKQEPESSLSRSQSVSGGDDLRHSSESRTRLLADSSTERESLDLSIHPRPCPFCTQVFPSSADLSQHIEDVHGESYFGMLGSDSHLHPRSEDEDAPAYYGGCHRSSVWPSLVHSGHGKETDAAGAQPSVKSPVIDLTE